MKLSSYIKIILMLLLLCLCCIRLWEIYAPGAGRSLNPAGMQDIAVNTVIQQQVMQPAEDFNTADNQISLNEQQINRSQIIKQTALSDPVINPFITDLQENVNSDILAWLTIDGTAIDYPVLSAPDNEYYLNRDVYGNADTAGSLFTDYRCAPDFEGLSTIIYGHNMKNRSMFGSLRSFEDEQYFDNHRRGTLYTGTRTYALDIFAFMVTSSDDALIYANPLLLTELYDYIEENARVFRATAQKNRILALSTCSYEFDGARIVVFAQLDPD